MLPFHKVIRLKMKKIGLIVAILLIPFLAYSKINIPFISSTPKVEVNIDSFTGETTVSTGWEDINDKILWMKFVYKDGTEFIEMKYISGEQLNINPETPLMVQSSNGVTTFTPLETYGSGIGNAAINGQGERLWGITAVYSGSLECFDNGVTTIRISTLEGNKDFKLSKGTTKKLTQLYNAFAEEVEKVKSAQ